MSKVAQALLRKTRLSDWLAALLLFVLLREWLVPLPALTDTGELTPFLCIIGGVLVLDLAVKQRWLSLLGKLLGVAWLLHEWFFLTPFFDGEWLRQVYVQLWQDLPLALQQNWTDMTLVSRNLLFFLLLIGLVSLVSYLVLEQRQGLWFVCLTEAYLATLDTFMPYDADGGIVRSLIAGFLLLAVIHFSAMERFTSFSRRQGYALWKTLAAPALIASLIVGVAYAAPKKEASWPDPLAFFGGGQGGGSVGYLKKVGYDDNDTMLGGPFVQDNTLVFRAATTQKHYWRGDSKDVYTGRGWEKSGHEYEAIIEPREHVWTNMLFHNTLTKEARAVVEFSDQERYPAVFYPGQLKQVINYDPENTSMVYDSRYHSIETRAGVVEVFNAADPEHPELVPNNLLQRMNGYELVAEVPVLVEKQLREAEKAYPAGIAQIYLQLPESLPARVRELAERITANAATPYEKVRAIEFYLRSSGNFRYETEDVPIPQPDQDFVDHFLFESRRGYCDHFSTSMAVMLRAVGIPTRWVKGFAPGTEIGTDARGYHIMEVRNQDAHSWVEVYFPGYGWVPFEATVSFPSPVEVQYDLVDTPATQPALPSTSEQNERDAASGRLDELEQRDRTSTDSAGFSRAWWWLFGAGLAALAGTVWLRRQSLWLWWLKRQMEAYPEERFPAKYGMLLRLYERFYEPRRQAETLREYVHRLGVDGDARKDLLFLTQLYERICYGYKEVEQNVRNQAAKVMERLTRRLAP